MWKDTVLLRAGGTVDILLYVHPVLDVLGFVAVRHPQTGVGVFSFEVAPSSEGEGSGERR